MLEPHGILKLPAHTAGKETAMELNDLIARYSDTPDHQQKVSFSLLFTLANQLQTVFDQTLPDLSLRQFMVLRILQHSKDPISLSEMGAILGCSRQNIKKMASVLESQGLLEFVHNDPGSRTLYLQQTEQAEDWFSRVSKPYESALDILFSSFSAEETRTFLALMEKLLQGTRQLKSRK